MPQFYAPIPRASMHPPQRRLVVLALTEEGSEAEGRLGGLFILGFAPR
jgi:hypothetical protein